MREKLYTQINLNQQPDALISANSKYRSRIHERKNFVEVSGHNLESYQACGFRIQCLHAKPVSNHFCLGEGGVISVVVVTVNSKEENS